MEKIVNIDTTVLRLHDKIVWLSDYGPEYGVVKWIGHLPENDTSKNELVAGIEFVSHPYFWTAFRLDKGQQRFLEHEKCTNKTSLCVC